MSINRPTEANGTSVAAVFADWLFSARPGDTQERLRQLATLFDANGAGLVGPLPSHCPAKLAWWKGEQAPENLSALWQRPAWLTQLRQHPDALAVVHAGRSWLVADLGDAEQQTVIWLAAELPRTFSETDARLLPLAGFA